MNIITRTKNNLEYAYYRKLGETARVKMEEHVRDTDDTKFKYWAKMAANCARKCLGIPLH